MTKTSAHAQFPEILWERGEYVEMGMYNCYGESADGRKWIGMWINFEFAIEITNIEEA